MSNKSNQYSTGPLVFEYNAKGNCLKGGPVFYHKKIGTAPPNLKFEIKCIGDTLDRDLVLSVSENGKPREFSEFFDRIATPTITLTKCNPSMPLEFKSQLNVDRTRPLQVGGIGLELRLHHDIPSCDPTHPHPLEKTHVDLHVEC